MNDNTNLIVMLTYNDVTVKNAYEIFEKSKYSDAKIWGFKEEGLSLDEMKRVYYRMKEYDKTTVLEVVAYTEKECIEGAKMAIACNCDMLLGTLYFDSVNELCKENNIKYMPFVGTVIERPSILEGTIDGMLNEIEEYRKKGVDGIDLLGYRYIGDPFILNKEIVSGSNLPICIAGSINSVERLDEIMLVNPWAFTIGTAFFEHKFGDSFEEQINNVYNYINGDAKTLVRKK